MLRNFHLKAVAPLGKSIGTVCKFEQKIIFAQESEFQNISNVSAI